MVYQSGVAIASANSLNVIVSFRCAYNIRIGNAARARLGLFSSGLSRSANIPWLPVGVIIIVNILLYRLLNCQRKFRPKISQSSGKCSRSNARSIKYSNAELGCSFE